jgi:ABC-2 type transport system ATP-binding protein
MTGGATPAVIIRGITKRYSNHVAVRDLSLTVPAGRIYGILGPNGAGKTTTLRMIMRVISPDEGTITLLGRQGTDSRDILRRVGYLPEERGLYRRMRVIDTIVFFARLKGVDPRRARREGTEWLERMGLAEWRNARVQTLSKGMQQKVQFITTILHGPDILVLDEPFSGLDPVNQEVLRDAVIAARDEGRTVLFCTHVLQQAQYICEEVCIIAGGRKVLEGEVRTLRREAAGNRFEIEFEEDTEATRRFLGDGRLFHEAEISDGRWEAALRPGVEPRTVLREVSGLDTDVRRFMRVEPSLHEIFVRHVGEHRFAHRNGGAGDA